MPELPRFSRRQLQVRTAAAGATVASVRYAELHCKSNFSFLEGASHPDELVQTAASLGYTALAITDRNSLAGVVRAHVAAKAAGIKLLIGAEVTPEDAAPVVLLATDRAAYGRLARLLTVGRRRAPKGQCLLAFDDLASFADGLIACVVINKTLRSDPHPVTAGTRMLQRYREVFGDRCYAFAERHLDADDDLLIRQQLAVSEAGRVPLVAANDVHYHVPDRRSLQDVLTAIRHRCEVSRLGHRMFANSERYLKTVAQMHSLFAGNADTVARSAEIADRCTFSLDELRYEYPEELGQPGVPALQYLKQLTWDGARERYPQGIPDRVRDLILHEFEVRGVLPDRVGPGAICSFARHPLSGARVRGEFGGVLLPWHHVCRSTGD